MDGSPDDDLSFNSVTAFANKWLVNGLEDTCESPIKETLDVSEEIVQEAQRFCSVIKNDKFKVCKNKILNTEAYIEACIMDYTKCIMVNESDCGCSSIAVYAEDCLGKDEMVSWRDDNLCRKYYCR